MAAALKELERNTCYWLREEGGSWRQVTLGEFILAERDAGFYPKHGSGVATAGFFSSTSTLEGAVSYDGKPPRE